MSKANATSVTNTTDYVIANANPLNIASNNGVCFRTDVVIADKDANGATVQTDSVWIWRKSFAYLSDADGESVLLYDLIRDVAVTNDLRDDFRAFKSRKFDTANFVDSIDLNEMRILLKDASFTLRVIETPTGAVYKNIVDLKLNAKAVAEFLF